ncbi:unnamed protein product [Prunus armeniaca]|uniref:Bromo domain-containing protein n=1 Tax=Prunus armeniaca TaxID=36596 RepID=A0A6J5TKD9_PRUAR|nr:unnamed protein product [Prunus armeniaca]
MGLDGKFKSLRLKSTYESVITLDSSLLKLLHDLSYQLGKPSTEDRFLFFDHLIEAALSVLLEGITKKSQESVSVPELPKAPKVASGPKVSELKAKVEAEQHALRRLRMCLRDVCNRLLYDKRFGAFHYPVSEEDAPNYRTIIQNPIDVAKLLQNVDSGQYITCSSFLQDVDLIVSNAKAYNGDDYNGARIVSRAHELRDAVHGMLSQMDPALVAYCDKIAAEGGPEHIPDGLGVSTFPVIPVVQLGTVTRASARLRNVQLEVPVDQNYEACRRPKRIVEPQLEVPVDQNYEALKQPKRNAEPQLEVHVDENYEVLKWPNRNVEPAHAGLLLVASCNFEIFIPESPHKKEGKRQKRLDDWRNEGYSRPKLNTVFYGSSTAEDKSWLQDSILSKSSQEPETNETNPEVPESSHQHETSGEISGHNSHVIGSQDITMSDGEMTNQIESVRRLFVERTENYDIPQLERLYTRIMKGIFDIKHKGDIDGTKPSILRYLLKFAEGEANL